MPYFRVKVPLKQDQPPIDTATDLWPAANWYERDVWKMFGIRFQGHPNLERILMPRMWAGHPLMKDRPARATAMGPFQLPDDFHRRRAEKIGERQAWQSYSPYTDRIDYLGGAMNNMAYLMAVEKLAAIEVPPRAKVMRVMLAELFRIISHLVWCETFAPDLGQQLPVFDTFNDRERAFAIIEAVCGARMTPTGSASAGWRRIWPTAGTPWSRIL